MFVEHRVGDKRILRLIQRWLAAGVLENGKWSATEDGTPQGATISPLLANVYVAKAAADFARASQCQSVGRLGPKKKPRPKLTAGGVPDSYCLSLDRSDGIQCYESAEGCAKAQVVYENSGPIKVLASCTHVEP